MANNELQLTPLTFAGLASLEELNLSANRMSYLPPTVFRPLTLKTLDLSDNKLLSMPASLLSTLPSLEKLLLKGNLLSTVRRQAYSLYHPVSAGVGHVLRPKKPARVGSGRELVVRPGGRRLLRDGQLGRLESDQQPGASCPGFNVSRRFRSAVCRGMPGPCRVSIFWTSQTTFLWCSTRPPLTPCLLYSTSTSVSPETSAAST